MPSRTRFVTVLLFALVVILAGCSGGGGGDAGGAGSGANASGGSAGDAVSGSSGSGGGKMAGGAQTGPQALQARQSRIKTGRVDLTVENVTTTQENLTRAARRAGGYVSASSATTHSVDGENSTTGRVVLRVPSRNFSALFSQVTAAGTVQDENTSSTDVGGKLVDLRARLNNSRAQRDRLLDLYANASNTKATLRVQKRLSNVQSRIERLEGRLQSLQGRIAYSTIAVDLAESTPEPDVERWYDTGVAAAFLSSVGGVVTAIRAIVIALAYLAPYLLVFGLPIGVVGYVAYRRRAG